METYKLNWGQIGIDTVQRAGEEEARSAFEVVRNKVKEISTAGLEKFIDSRYEAGAPQEELDLLETLFDERVSEDDQSVTEEEQNISEETHQGAGLVEQLIGMYHRYLNSGLRNGMEVEDILGNMRSALETYGFASGGFKKDTTDGEILALAKELYEDKQDLIKKYKSKNKISNIQVEIFPETRLGTTALDRSQHPFS
jgi:hypothetical protein